jgi:DNA processing protein
MNEEILYTIALTQASGIGIAIARKLIELVGSARAVFTERTALSHLSPSIRERVAQMLDCGEAVERAARECAFAEKNGIACIPYGDERYPRRLRECADAPVLLYYKGAADLNAARIVSVVGTRRITDYGRQCCEHLMSELAVLCPDTLVVSGLAYGVDVKAHTAALANGLPTVGILAHGLDRIYPHDNRKVAVEMLAHGGLLTEYPSGTRPEAYNFVARNRIVAGMSDATIVVESAAKGGSLITAGLAGDYHRDCFAFAGRATDPNSAGCNALIRDNKAVLIQSADDFVRAMNWDTPSGLPRAEAKQLRIFDDLSDEEQEIVHILEREGEVQLNTLAVGVSFPMHRLNALLLDLEMRAVVRTLAGGLYRLK